MAKIKLSAPWNTYYEQVKALFGDDSEIHIVFDEEKKDLKLYVDTDTKAEALQNLFPIEKEWGGVTMTITVIPPNRENGFKIVRSGEMTSKEIIEYAFYNNPHFVKCIGIDFPLWSRFVYAMFKNEVIQYYTDDLGDPNGMTSTLAQDIAKEIFEPVDGVYYCTELSKKEKEKVTKWSSLPSGTFTATTATTLY